MNIIGDIAGQYNGLMRLIDKMPDDEIILVGDLIDRGQESKEVIQWAIDHQIESVLGNHEHMMIDYYDRTDIYHQFIWVSNGGGFTSLQYKEDKETLAVHLKWLKSLPLYIERDGMFISHAAKPGWKSLEAACDLSTFGSLTESIIWNREHPAKDLDFQVFGHNSPWGLKWFGEKNDEWAVCLDDSRQSVLTGLHTPTMTIYQEPYMRPKPYMKEERSEASQFNT